MKNIFGFVVVCMTPFAWIGGAAAGSIPTPQPGACTVLYGSDDFTAGSRSWSFDLLRYGGDGCEVMVDVQGVVSGDDHTYGGSISYQHVVRLTIPLPSGVPLPSLVPIDYAP